MTYPLDQLAIVAPILFIVLASAFPIIGIFAGWKRGLYWGGGNLVVYLLGLLIWRLAGPAIAAAIAPMISSLLESLGGSGDVTQLALSFLTPIFFILWFAINELALIINYFAWYKRVVGLKKPKANKDANGKQRVAKAQVNTKQGPKMKAINMVGGALCLGALTIPTTIAFTDSIYYLTTSRATRAKNSLSNNLYNGLHNLQKGMWWMSYYTVGNTAADFDGLFAGITMMTKQIEYKRPDGGSSTGTITQAVTDIFTNGFSDVFHEAVESDIQESVIIEDLNNLAGSWNYLIDNYVDDVAPLFESENVVTFVSSLLDTMFDQKPDLGLTDDNIGEFFKDGGVFSDIEAAYQSGKWGEEEITQLSPINVSDKAFDNIQSVLVGTFDTSNLQNPENQELFNEKIAEVMEMIFNHPSMQ